MSNIIITPSPKEAALYYDYVVPLGLYFNNLSGILDSFSLVGQALPEVVPSVLDGLQSDPNADLKREMAVNARSVIRDELLPPNLRGRHREIEQLEGAMVAQALDRFREHFFQSVASNKIHDIKNRYQLLGQLSQFVKPVVTKELIDFLSLEKMEEAVLDFPSFNIGRSFNSMELSIKDVNVIDASKVDWEQIFEIRKDKVARNQLLNFRKYFYTEISSLSQSSAREEIERLQANYIAAAEKHGCDLMSSTLSTVIDSKMAIAGVGGLILAANSGNWPMMLASSVPIVLKAGEFILTAKRSYHEGIELANSHPVSYLVTVEKALKR